MTTRLILASSSVYRQSLLDKLGLAYETVSPALDEQPLLGEQPEQLVTRLAIAKAKAVAQTHTGVLIIGADQVATLQGQILTKPGNHANAVAQLQYCSGQWVTFLTGLCLYNSDSQCHQAAVVPYRICFRHLTEVEIEAYLQREQPYDCAGSIKSEALGVALCEKFEGEDPNALVGLPLIALAAMLRQEGVDPLAAI